MYAIPRFFVERRTLNSAGTPATGTAEAVYEIWEVLGEDGGVSFSCLSEEQAVAIANALNMEDFYDGDVREFDR